MAIDVYSETGDIVATTPLPAGARQLGVRVKPILRLAMGHRNERGHPVKDDHFSPRAEDHVEAKFRAEYGDAPKSVEILLPSELEQALRIEYLAFRGGQQGDGGVLVARGQANFAHRDYCGGPDILTVYHPDGQVEEVETLGLDANTREPLDDVAKEWGIELYTTLTAMMPGVLGFGSYFALTTKGKESTDNLWLKLRELYGLFGSKITFAVKPHLVIRQSKARPVVEDRDTKEKRRITSTIYVADIVVPETIDEMIGRLQERQAAVAPNGAVAALYGDRALPAATAPVVEETNGASQQAAAPAVEPGTAVPGDEPIEDGDFEPIDEEQTVVEPSAEEFAAAAATKVGRGAWAGKTFAEIAEAGDEGAQWLLRQMKKFDPDDDGPGRKLAVFLQGRLPEVWAKYAAWKAEQS